MEEISLRELIEILLKRKIIIIGLTICAIAIAFVFTFYVQKPVYEAATILNVQNISYNTHSGSVNGTNIFLNSEDIDWHEFSQLDPGITQDSRALISSLIQYPSMSEEAYKNKLLGPELLDQVKDRIPELEESSVGKIRNKISVESNNGLFTIKIKDVNPKLAAEIGNNLSEVFISYVDKYNTNYVEKLNKYIGDAIENQEREMKEVSTELDKALFQNDKTKEKQLRIKHDIAKQIYEVLLFKKEQLNLVQMMDFGDKNVAVIRKAYEPEKPISPNKKLNLAISAVLGLMLGVFIAFFVEYWQTSGKAED